MLSPLHWVKISDIKSDDADFSLERLAGDFTWCEFLGDKHERKLSTYLWCKPKKKIRSSINGTKVPRKDETGNHKKKASFYIHSTNERQSFNRKY